MEPVADHDTETRKAADTLFPLNQHCHGLLRKVEKSANCRRERGVKYVSPLHISLWGRRLRDDSILDGRSGHGLAEGCLLIRGVSRGVSFHSWLVGGS